MKTKLAATILLTAICLLFVVSGASNAQTADPSYTVYLPFVSKPPCTLVPPSMYFVVNKPVVRVGEVVTVTGALVNDCAIVNRPFYSVDVWPNGILAITQSSTSGLPSVPSGSYDEVTLTMQAVAAGEVTVYFRVIYTDSPTRSIVAAARPYVMRVLP